MPGEKARDFKGSMRSLIRYLDKYKWLILLALLLAAGSTIFAIFGPRTLGEATTELYLGVQRMIQNDPLGIDFARLSQILVQVMLLYLVSSLLGVLQGYVLTTISARITYQLRKEISEKLNRLPLSYFDQVTHGEVLSRVTNDVDTINQTLNQSLSQMITSITRVIGVLFMMLSINWLMTLIGVTMVPIAMILIKVVVSKSQVYYRQQQEFLGHINGHVEEMYGGHVVLKAFNGEAASIARFEELNDTLYSSAWKSQFLSAIIQPSMRLISNLGYVAVAMLGGYQVIQGRLNVGEIQAFIQYLRSFQEPLMQIANITNILQQTAAAAERVFEILNEKEETPDVEDPVHPCEVEGAVEFRNVRFGYDPEKPVINEFSLKVEPGQQIAIVGPTGAGKTTIVKLLMRFYDVDSGEILIDDVNIQDMTREDLRSKFAMVLQDTWLFNGTIRENIRYGRQDATDEEVERAADMAYADHFTRTLPGGYEMVLNEDASNVSAGQKQLLTIARAVLADPAILILDEATSSVDTRTEVLIQKAMDKLMKGRTSFVIAHRLSTIRNADRILVLRDGDILEQGTHESLLADDGFYAELYNSQFVTQPA
ncbi:MAG: ABC transporter ATP-binding protein [Chloroflexi bacterium]|nr:ABC transporter ATP-binding protein [Chloroflexota bacterium]